MSSNDNFGAGIIDDVLYVLAAMPAVDPSEPVSDPFGAKAARSRSELPDPTLLTGTIHLIIPYTGFARVQADHGRGSFRCSVGDSPRTPEHGESYVVSADIEMGVGTLSHRQPIPRVSSRDYYSDVIVHGSGVGFYGQAVYTRYVNDTVDKSGLVDYCVGQPFDQLPGDWGHIQKSGVGFHSDKLMMFARVSDTCGVFGYYLDNSLRVAGDQLAIESDAHAENYGNDNGELLQETAQYYLPWEMLGFGNSSAVETNITRNDPSRVVREGGYVWEAGSSEATPLSRINKFAGYVGQGELLVCGALAEPTDIIDQAAITAQSGLAKMFVGVGGQILIESAKRVTIAKSAIGYVPVRVKPAESEDDDADNLNNYKFSGQYGDGEDHELSDIRPVADDAVVDSFGSEVRALDIYALDSAYYAFSGIAQHKNDFKISEPSKLNETAGISGASLTSSDRLERPAPIDQVIDHRLTEKLYQLASLIQLNDDGSIVIQEALGASITLSGGVATVSGTSVRLLGGKVVHVAGGRIINRAVKDIDLVSGSGRVRAKAEKDLMLVAGCGGSGGILLESRSSGISQSFPDEPDNISLSGVVIKSANAPVCVLSAGTYIRSGIAEANIGTGDIILDAGAGKSRVIQRASDADTFVKNSQSTLFGVDPSSVSSGNFYAKTYNRFIGSIGTMGQLVVGQSIQAKGNIVTIAEVGKTSDPARLQKNIDDLSKDIQDSSATAGEALRQVVVDYYEGSNAPGNSNTASKISFGFPSSDRYGATNVKFAQPHWHTVVEAVDPGRLEQWDEPSVIYQPDSVNKPTYTWPGKEVWDSSSSWVYGDTEDAVFDPVKQTPKHPISSRDSYDSLTQSKSLGVKQDSISSRFKYIP